MTWKETLEKIQAGEETARAQALRRWDSLAKPLGSLGILEEAIVRIAALTGTAEVCLKNRALVVLCADNGVVSQGVSQSDASVTRAVTAALAPSRSQPFSRKRRRWCRWIWGYWTFWVRQG